MYGTYKKLYEILLPRERRSVLLLFALMFAAAVMETLGVASILPFMAVLANPEFVQENRYLGMAFRALGFQEPRSFMLFLGLVFFALFVTGLALRTVAFWAQAKFSSQRMHAMSCRVLDGYLAKDYEWFLNRNSATLATTILSEVSRAISEALFPALQIIAHAIVIVLLMVLLIVIDPVLAFSMVLVLSGLYLTVYLSLRGWLGRIGEDAFTSNRGRYRVTQEALGGIKDLKIKGLERSFSERFEKESERYARSRIGEQLVGQIPGYFIQAVIFGGMLLAILYLMGRHDSFQMALPVLATYAMAGYRLLPSLQNGYRQLVTLRNTVPVLDSLHADLKAIGVPAEPLTSPESRQPLSLHHQIRLRNVCYRYPGASRDALHGISLEIPRFASVAFVGSTGCGKTTTVDVILGLLKPSSGIVEVDGQPIAESNRRAWQRNIGYVPQDIYLADTSIAANIAYGLSPNEIDHAAVQRAAEIANLHEFVLTELPQGYDTVVGERGVRLSGGQRQRIGIARALYYDPELLVMDEATSALDNLTEQAVMEAVGKLARKKTIILIAHRLSTVKACDTIFLLSAGQVEASGTYSELIASSAGFKKMSGENAGALG